MLAQAIDGGAEVFITGEVSEPTVHLAREAGVSVVLQKPLHPSSKPRNQSPCQA